MWPENPHDAPSGSLAFSPSPQPTVPSDLPPGGRPWSPLPPPQVGHQVLLESLSLQLCSSPLSEHTGHHVVPQLYSNFCGPQGEAQLLAIPTASRPNSAYPSTLPTAPSRARLGLPSVPSPAFAELVSAPSVNRTEGRTARQVCTPAPGVVGARETVAECDGPADERPMRGMHTPLQPTPRQGTPLLALLSPGALITLLPDFPLRPSGEACPRSSLTPPPCEPPKAPSSRPHGPQPCWCHLSSWSRGSQGSKKPTSSAPRKLSPLHEGNAHSPSSLLHLPGLRLKSTPRQAQVNFL